MSAIKAADPSWYTAKYKEWARQWPDLKTLDADRKTGGGHFYDCCLDTMALGHHIQSAAVQCHCRSWKPPIKELIADYRV